MKRVYSIEEVRAAEARAKENGTDEIALMERAGRGLAEFVSCKLAKRKVFEVLFVCGGGNNGGDGFCAARILSETRKDIKVCVLCLAKKFSPACEAMRARYLGETLQKIPRKRFEFCVDCVLGTGICGAPKGDAERLIEFINENCSYVVAADLPSGLQRGGVLEGACVRADCTLSFGAEKEELYLADGADVSGEIFPFALSLPLEGGAEIFEREDVLKFFPKKKSHVNKGSFKKAAILAGCCAYPNASLFAAGGSLVSGAGYTSLFAGEELYLGAIGKTDAMLKKFEGIDEVLSSNAIALGMGAGAGEELYSQIIALLRRYEGVLILDADALNALAKFGAEILKEKKCRLILTPHIGEFARLIKRDAGEVLKEAVPLSRDFAREYGATVLLKNNRTVITDGERVCINLTGSPALAKGGSGDILSGFLAGTCARGVEPFFAGCVSSYLLGRAGEIAREFFGEYSATPHDILFCLKRALLSLSQDAHGDGESQKDDSRR